MFSNAFITKFNDLGIVKRLIKVTLSEKERILNFMLMFSSYGRSINVCL